MPRVGTVRLAATGLAVLLALIVGGVVVAAPFGTAFTYQGQLRQAGAAVNGTCDFQFGLFDALSGGSQIGATQAATGLTLVDGRFTVQLDFGGAAFDGNGRWLEIATRCPAGSGGFTTMTPRQPLSPSPYALFASGATTATSFSGNLAGDVTGTQGSTVVARLQGRTVVNTAPADGAVLRYNASLSQWEPVVPVDVNTSSYAFAYSVFAQPMAFGSFGNVFLEVVGTVDGWTIVGGGNTLIAPATGSYLMQYEANPSTILFTPGQASFRVTRNGTEIPGSQALAGVPPGASNHISKAFLAQLTASDALELQSQANTPGIALVPTGGGTTPVSASVTITRVN